MSAHAHFQSLEASKINGLRMWSSPDNTRLVFDVSAVVKHEIFILTDPHRVVIDIKDSQLKQTLPAVFENSPLIENIRTAKRNKKDLRIVLDLITAVKPNSFTLLPTDRYGHRLVLDLKKGESGVTDKRLTSPSMAKIITPKKKLTQGLRARPIIVAIDAGHGGEDPGALGPRGSKEKNIVLAIAKRFEKLLKQQSGFEPVMIRSSDYYVSLRGRLNLARKHRADLFVSIHADAVRNRDAKGASVFVLSSKGASSEAARWLANSQNNADLIGGVSLDDKDDLLASVLLDLSQNATIAVSTQIGSSILHRLDSIGDLHKGDVEQAGFVVLKSPDMPSILVETGFISNPREESKLKKSGFQQKVATALLNGVKSYFLKNPPEGSVLALRDRHHVTKKGDTLGSIAKQYHISQIKIRRANSLKNDQINVGQILVIPLKGDG